MINLHNNMKFEFFYDKEDDILSIYRKDLQPSETVEFEESINIDIDKEGFVVGMEIFDAGEFLGSLNKELNKEFLENLESIVIEDKQFRNNWYIILLLKAKNKEIISQPMPLLSKSEYKSPLIMNIV